MIDTAIKPMKVRNLINEIIERNSPVQVTGVMDMWNDFIDNTDITDQDLLYIRWHDVRDISDYRYTPFGESYELDGDFVEKSASIDDHINFMGYEWNEPHADIDYQMDFKHEFYAYNREKCYSFASLLDNKSPFANDKVFSAFVQWCVDDENDNDNLNQLIRISKRD